MPQKYRQECLCYGKKSFFCNMNIHIRQIARLTGHRASVYALVKGDTSAQFLSGGGEGWVIRWDAENTEQATLLAKVETNIFSLLYLPEKRLLLAGNMNGGLHWVAVDKQEDLRNTAYHKKGIFEIRYVNDYIYTAGGDGKLVKWSPETMRPVETFELTIDSLRTLAYNEARQEWAVGASDNAIYLLDNDLNIKKRIASAHDNSVFTIQYSPDGKHLLSGGRDAHLKVWNVEADFELQSTQPAHWFTINDISYHPEGHIFATASRDKTIKIWDAHTFKLLKVIDTARYGCHINSVNRLLWLSHQNYLVSCSDDRTVIIWELDIENI